jgi:hypothetical protein
MRVSARTPSATAAVPAGRRRLLPVLGLTASAVLGGFAAAGPAAAIDDSARPDARVTHGPSCRPGGVVVEVVAGTGAYAVTLATTRAPDGEDSARIEPGGTVVLRTGGVAWGETVDGWLEYRAVDGSGETWVDELDGYAFTRPAEEDCAAITAPAVPATAPGTAPLPPGTTGDAATVGAVDVTAAAPVPAALAQEPPIAPLFAAAVALGAAATGLAGALGVPGLRRRRPTPGA